MTGGAAATRSAFLRPAVLGMAVFLGTEVMFFAGLGSAIAVLRTRAGTWSPPHEVLWPLPVSLLSMALLLASGVVVVWSLRRGASQALPMTFAALFGAAFLAIQGTEWVRALVELPFGGGGLMSAVFATAIGAHLTHAAAGLVTLILVARGRVDALAGGMFWLFVVVVWPVLFVLLYR